MAEDDPAEDGASGGSWGELPSALVDEVTERRPMPHAGYSGASLERITLRDGTRLVLKHISPARSWAMRVTNDHGREAALWRSGLLDRVSDVIEDPVVLVEPEDEGWTIVMRDVSDLLRSNERYSLADNQRIVTTITGLHNAFRGERIDGLCALADRFRVMSPAAVNGVEEPFPLWVSRGWDLFAQIAPDDIRESTFRIMESPEPLAMQLEQCETTLIHGDLRIANMGFDEDRLVCSIGPGCHRPARG
jgi:hypothetical protein